MGEFVKREDAHHKWTRGEGVMVFCWLLFCLIYFMVTRGGVRMTGEVLLITAGAVIVGRFIDRVWFGR